MVDKIKNKRSNPLFVGSIEKGMQVLEAFDEGNRQLGLNAIVELTGLNRSAVQRFLHTWESLGYLYKDAATKQFRLTPKVMSLSYNFLRGERLIEVATPFLLDARERDREFSLSRHSLRHFYHLFDPLTATAVHFGGNSSGAKCSGILRR